MRFWPEEVDVQQATGRVHIEAGGGQDDGRGGQPEGGVIDPDLLSLTRQIRWVDTIHPNMGLEAINGGLSVVLHPASITVFFIGGGNDDCIDQSPGLDRHRLRLELLVDGFEQSPGQGCLQPTA